MLRHWVTYALTDDEIAVCMRYGRLMREGKVRLPNVKYRDIDNVETYTDGKIGEWAFYRWLQEYTVTIHHVPFREDYSILNPDDDFIIEIHGKCTQVEVRHKTRNYPPQVHYEHCSDTVKTDRIYVFTERQRAQDARRNPKTSVAYFRGPVRVLGWIDPARFRKVARREPAGTTKMNDSGEENFTLHRDEWNLYIRNLYEMDKLLANQYASVIPWKAVPSQTRRHT